MVAVGPARHPPPSGIGSLMAYWRFYRAVAASQLAGWLASSVRHGGALLVDMSGPHLPCAAQAAAAGHRVVHLMGPDHGVLGAQDAAHATARPVLAAARGSPVRAAAAGGGVVANLRADPAALPFLADRCVDGVIADDRTLSRHLFTEQAMAEIARVLRPGGHLLACFDSLVLGMAVLAEQRHWPELIDLPNAEVVLVPWPDGAITRCFGVEQLRELFAEARLEITWIRPRTALSPTTVEHVLNSDRAALADLVRAELAAEPDDSVGIHLIVNARKKGRPVTRRRRPPAQTR
ncbi:MAG: methyltransferase domain-containing protein [Micromonosporaceae bacterium]